MKKLIYFIQISRPLNFVITFFSLIVAGLICNNNSLNINIILAGISAAFVGSAGNIINDIYDIEIDKFNRPDRILVSKKLSVFDAKLAFIFLNIAAIVLAYLIDYTALFIVIISIVTIFAYSAFLKKVVLLGNIIVSFFTGLTFIYGGASVSNIDGAFVPAIFAFLTNLIRELIKDIEDIKGDSANNVTTFPSKFGIDKTKNLILVLTIILIIVTTVPYFYMIYKIEFFIIVMAIINPIFIFMIKRLYSSNEVSIMKQCSSLTKANMIIGLAAIYIGAI